MISLPSLRLHCAVLLLAACGLAAAQSPAPQQNEAALPAWDVATVKPASPDARGSMIHFTPDGIRITNVSLFAIVRDAFGLEDDRMFDVPNWTKTSNFDIEVKVAMEDVPKLKGMSIDQRRQMVIALLEERCGLKFHHETRELPVYRLVVAKSGSKLTASPPDDGGEPKDRHMLMMHGRGHIESTATDIRGLTRVLSAQLHRTVVDQTGLKGNFDYKLDWSPDDAAPLMARIGDSASGNADAQGDGGPSLFTALEEQLGLKLDAAKAPADVIVIDHIEQPSLN